MLVVLKINVARVETGVVQSGGLWWLEWPKRIMVDELSFWKRLEPNFKLYLFREARKICKAQIYEDLRL